VLLLLLVAAVLLVLVVRCSYRRHGCVRLLLLLLLRLLRLLLLQRRLWRVRQQFVAGGAKRVGARRQVAPVDDGAAARHLTRVRANGHPAAAAAGAAIARLAARPVAHVLRRVAWQCGASRRERACVCVE
jgi:hypothetical protein